MKKTQRSIAKLPFAKAWLLAAATFSSVVRSKAQDVYAFEMLEAEEIIPPYKVVPAENVSDYQLASFQEVDSNGEVTGIGVLAFTLYDIAYTQENLLCEEEDCCEARNYSYESVSIDAEEDYFPPCSIDELVSILKQNCSLVAFNQTIPREVFSQNLSSICSYYTIYNQSNVSTDLFDCVQAVFEASWGSYCSKASYDIDNAVIGLSFSAIFLLCLCLLRLPCNKNLLISQQKLLTLSTNFPLVPVDYIFLYYSLSGFIYSLDEVLEEHNFEPDILSVNLTETIIIAIFYYVLLKSMNANIYYQNLPCCNKKKRVVIAGSLVNDVFSTMLYASLKSFSIFVLTLEFYASEFGEIDNQTLILTGSILMATVSLLKNLRELNFLKACLFVPSIQNSSHKGWVNYLKSWGERNDYLCQVYPRIHLLISSLLAPIVFGSFLSTFSSMTVTAGSDLTMQTLSYIAFVALNYCASIIGEDNHDFHLAHETLITAMESWAFMYKTYLNIVTHEQAIDQIVYYEEYSNDPYIFSALMLPVNLFYLYYQLSVSRFIPELLKATVNHAKMKQESEKDKDEQTSLEAPSSDVLDAIITPQETRTLTRLLVARDGECGYTAFGILRKQAAKMLKENLRDEAVMNLLHSPIHEALLTQEFYAYLCQGEVISKDLSHADLITSVEDYLNRFDIIEHYLSYDLLQKNIDGGYAHPAVLQALAHVQGIRVRMWRLDSGGNLVHHRSEGSYDYADYSPPGIENPTELDLLYVGGNHFDILAPVQAEHSLKEGDKDYKRRSASSMSYEMIGEDLEDLRESNEALTLTKKQTLYVAQDLDHAHKDRRYELMITSTKPNWQRAQYLNALDDTVFFNVIFRTVSGGYFLAKIANYCCSRVSHYSKPEDNDRDVENSSEHAEHSGHHDHDETKTIDVIIHPETGRETIKVNVRYGHDHDHHNALRVHGPTMTAILMTLLLGSSPFVINLSDAMIAVRACLSDLHNNSGLNCSAECFNHYSNEIDVQDIGSSWLVLACCLIVMFVTVKEYVVDRHHSIDAESDSNPEASQQVRRQQLRLASLIYYSSVAIISFVLGGLASTQWKNAFDVGEEYGMNCSNGAPFRDTKHHLETAGILSFLIGGSITGLLAIRLIAVAIHERGQCLSKLRSSTSKAANRVAEATSSSQRPESFPSLPNDANSSAESAALLSNDGASSSQAGLQLQDTSLASKSASSDEWVDEKRDSSRTDKSLNSAQRSLSRHSVLSAAGTNSSAPDSAQALDDQQKSLLASDALDSDGP